MTIRIPFPLPLRDDFMSMIELPDDLTADEAERVARYVRSIGPEPMSDDPPDFAYWYERCRRVEVMFEQQTEQIARLRDAMVQIHDLAALGEEHDRGWAVVAREARRALDSMWEIRGSA